MKFASALLATLGLALSVPAMAQDQSPPPSVVTQFDEATIVRMLNDVQTTWDIETGTDNMPIYRAKANGGIAFTVTPRVCSDETGCVGLLMIAVYTQNGEISLAELDAFLNRYNDRNPQGKVYRANGQAVVLQGYINSVFGITYSNAQAQLLVFGNEIAKLRTELAALGSE